MRRVWIVAESLHSMDGDFGFTRRSYRDRGPARCVPVVDEAHATGVYGHYGRGIPAPYEGRENLLWCSIPVAKRWALLARLSLPPLTSSSTGADRSFLLLRPHP